MKNTKSLLIMDGPSKFDLMNSLFDDKIVTFTIADQLEKKQISSVKVKIAEVKISFSFHNLTRQDGYNLKMIVVEIQNDPYFDIECKDGLDGWYDSKTRKGNVSDWNW